MSTLLTGTRAKVIIFVVIRTPYSIKIMDLARGRFRLGLRSLMVSVLRADHLKKMTGVGLVTLEEKGSPQKNYSDYRYLKRRSGP